MKNLILVAVMAWASCCTSKKTTETNTSGTVPAMDTASTVNNAKPTPDTVVVKTPPPPPPKTEPAKDKTPACIDKLIQTFREEKVQNPPRKIYSYTYKGKTVYYVPAICCDFFSDLYDANCNLIGHPDGGITGKGDGKTPDFEKARSSEKLVWEDTRKR